MNGSYYQKTQDCDSNLVYTCTTCDFITSHLGMWKRHLETKKHKSRNDSKKSTKNTRWKCECGKTYKYDTGYYRHKKVCGNKSVDKERKIMMAVEKLGGVVEKLTENVERLAKRPTTQINGNNNNIYNLHLFLNKECANAMTIQDFSKQIKLTMSDLLKDKSDCITNVIINNIDPLDVRERPFHCSNINHNKWIIKDNKAGWQEDDGGKIIKATEDGIGKMWTSKFYQLNPEWELNPLEVDNYIKVVNKTCTNLNVKETKQILKKVAKTAELKII